MNSTKRFLFGIVSSLLLAAGFAHAAEGLDPMNKSLEAKNDNPAALAATEPCNSPCDINDPT